MNFILWFLGGLALVAAISYGVAHLFKAKAESEEPLAAENLPKNWESVMPQEKKTQAKTSSKTAEPSFRKIGVRSKSGGRGFK